MEHFSTNSLTPHGVSCNSFPTLPGVSAHPTVKGQGLSGTVPNLDASRKWGPQTTRTSVQRGCKSKFSNSLEWLVELGKALHTRNHHFIIKDVDEQLEEEKHKVRKGLEHRSFSPYGWNITMNWYIGQMGSSPGLGVWSFHWGSITEAWLIHPWPGAWVPSPAPSPLGDGGGAEPFDLLITCMAFLAWPGPPLKSKGPRLISIDSGMVRRGSLRIQKTLIRKFQGLLKLWE